ncbi:MAG: PspC domain-containing protein, partial [Eubacteriales bacterium]|nr:PspC domain-containing protein [Eubacteriales bacterium]MDD4582900.1 PspC domain-containing protein [Eubacteriales bacterium]
ADDRVLAGVCGGIGEYFGIDPVIVRLLVVVLTLAGGSGLIAYIIAAIIIPEKHGRNVSDQNYSYDGEESYANNDPAEKKNNSDGVLVIGVILVFLGGFMLLRGFIPWIPREFVLAVILIGLGLYFIVKKVK